MQALPGGSFKLKLKERRTTKQGLSFLGHHVQARDGRLRIWPSSESEEQLVKKLSKFERKLNGMLLVGAKPDMQKAKEELARMWAIIDGWRNAFSACDEIDAIVGAHTDSWAKWCAELEITHAEILPHVTADMKFTPPMSSSAYYS